ncbi:hypothetical protein C5167_022317, partial [Papaver somniferum]
MKSEQRSQLNFYIENHLGNSAVKYRYISVGPLLDVVPSKRNWRSPSYYAPLMASESASGWVC